MGHEKILLSAILCFWLNGLNAVEMPKVDEHWIIRDDGALVFSPDPAYGDLGAYHLCQYFSQPSSLAEIFMCKGKGLEFGKEIMETVTVPHLCAWLIHGGLDLVNLCDAERHFEKLRLGTPDFALDISLSNFDSAQRRKREEERGRGPSTIPRWFTSRISLDGLVAMYMLERKPNFAPFRKERILKRLPDVVDDETMDPLTREAGKRTLALLNGQPVERQAAQLPDLKSSISYFKSSPDFLCVVQSSKCPLLATPCKIGFLVSRIKMWGVLLKKPDDLNIIDLQADEIKRDSGGEVPYEIARHLGNCRWDRVAIAGWKEEKNWLWSVVMDGVFPAEKWKGELKELAREEKDGLTYVKNPNLLIGFSSRRLVVGQRLAISQAEKNAGILGDWEALSKAGIEKECLCWIKANKSAISTLTQIKWSGIPTLDSAIATISLKEKNLIVQFEGSFDTQERASSTALDISNGLKQAANSLIELCKDPEAKGIGEGLQRLTVAAKEKMLSLNLEMNDCTPESFFEIWMRPVSEKLEKFMGTRISLDQNEIHVAVANNPIGIERVNLGSSDDF